MKFLMERAESLRTWKQGEEGTGEHFLNQSIREVKWKDLPNVTRVIRGKSKASVSGVATRLLPHAECLVTPGHHVSSSCFLSGSASHHSITTLSAPTPLPSLKPLPKWKLWSPWSSCSEDRNRGYSLYPETHDSKLGMKPSMVWPQRHASWLHSLPFMFYTWASSHFLTMLLTFLAFCFCCSTIQIPSCVFQETFDNFSSYKKLFSPINTY